MRYRVRTVDGELFFEGLYDVEKAWRQGLVSPEDEILEAGQDQGVLARHHPHLSKAPGARSWYLTAQTLRVALAIVLGVTALAAWHHTAWPLGMRAGIVGVVAIMLLTVLSSVTVQASKRRRR